MRTILYTGKQSRTVRHDGTVWFHCNRCRQIKETAGHGGGTGFAVRPDDTLICYACCGQTDRLDMLATGKAVLYLSKSAADDWHVGNWPGTLKFRTGQPRKFRHPWSRHAVMAYFTGPDGKPWSAKNIGDSQIAHCRRLKA